MAAPAPLPEERFMANGNIIMKLVIHLVTLVSQKGQTKLNPKILEFLSRKLAEQDPRETIIKFIDNSYEHWPQIKQRNEEHFDANISSLFASFDENIVAMFVDLFKARDNTGAVIVGKEYRDKIWDILGAMVKTCIVFVHENNGPFVDEDGACCYSKPFMTQIPFLQLAHEWNITLKY